MSDFLQQVPDSNDDGGWETVPTKTKIPKKSKEPVIKTVKEMENFIEVSLDLYQDSFCYPSRNIQPVNKTTVGQLLIHPKKGIILQDKKTGVIRRNPPPRLYKDDAVAGVHLKPAPAATNPFNQFDRFDISVYRAGLFNPDSVLPSVNIIIGRGCQKKIMKCFEYDRVYPISPPTPSTLPPGTPSPAVNPYDTFQFSFQIRRIENLLIIEDTEIWSNDPAYGYAFEHYMTRVPLPYDKDCYFFRNITYELDDLKLLVGFEVDCVLNNPPYYSSVELKTHNVRYTPPFLDYWYVLSLSDTRYLSLGSIDKYNGTLSTITKKQITDLLPPDHEALTNRFTQLTDTLQWIKKEFDEKNGKEGFLSYSSNDRTKLHLKISG
jgi:hypothetical protein